MTILALEFSSPQRSVAVLREAGTVVPAANGSIQERTGPETNGEPNPRLVHLALSEVPSGTAGRMPAARNPRSMPLALSEVIEAGGGHAMKPLRMIEEALQQAGAEREEIECIAIGLGPGSYTGIRAAIALAQGWELALGVKLLGVGSAEAIAAEAAMAGLSGRVAVVIDAQRGEFYLATGEAGADLGRATRALRLASLEEIQRRGGEGETIVGPEVTKWFPSGRVIFPCAAAVGRLVLGRTDFTPGKELEPIYLREATFVKAPPAREFPA